MTHAWCSDPSRDAAVRAAEDGRDRPLPTLAEAIAAPFACSACGGYGMDHRCKESCDECDGDGRAMLPKSGSASSTVEQENKGVRMTKSDRQAADYRAEAIAAVTECRSEQTKGEEMSQGLRTERVTLEVTHGESFGVSHWSWVTILRLQSGESVRVVDDDRPSVMDEDGDRIEMTWGELANFYQSERDVARAERDAAIRELSAEKMWRDNLAMQRNEIRDERDALKARVAELEAASGGNRPETPVSSTPAASGGGEGEPYMVTASGIPLYRQPPQPRGWLTEDERDIIAGIANDDEYTEEGQNIAKALLARSSPPEVVLPENPYHPSGLREGFEHAIRIVRNELINAGVPVKKVGQ
jgi:hypothetical protein